MQQCCPIYLWFADERSCDFLKIACSIHLGDQLSPHLPVTLQTNFQNWQQSNKLRQLSSQCSMYTTGNSSRDQYEQQCQFIDEHCNLGVPLTMMTITKFKLGKDATFNIKVVSVSRLKNTTVGNKTVHMFFSFNKIT